MIQQFIYDNISCELEFKGKQYVNIGHPVTFRNQEAIFPDQIINEACILKAIRYKNKKGRTVKLIKYNTAFVFGDILKLTGESMK